jgi:hypothetical protein
MNSDESFDNSPCADQMRLAERELASFVGAVTELFGPEQARLCRRLAGRVRVNG